MKTSDPSYQMEELVVGEILERRAAEQPTAPLAEFRSGTITYGEVNAMADRIARGLTAHGVTQFDHVAVMLPNCPEFIYITIALAKLGAIMVPVNTAYSGDLLAHVIDSSDVGVLIVADRYLDAVGGVAASCEKLASVIIVPADEEPSTVRGLTQPTLVFDWLLREHPEFDRPKVTHGDLQAIMYTSGTTGPSKGAMIPHALALTDSLDFIRYMDYTADDVTYCPLPLFHAAGLWDGFMATVLAGARIAIVDRFSASRFWDDIRQFKATVCMSVFSMIPILQNQPPSAGDREHSLRLFYMGKSDLDADFYGRFGVHTPETYTSTEVGIGTASPYGSWRSGSCGQVNSLRHEVRIVDELDRELPPGEPGEIVVRPRQPFAIFSGYYNNPRATMEAFRNLWFHTGDRAYRDEEGYFYFVERMKDTIRRRGENISAFDVERSVNSHPAVLESAAFAVPSEVEEDEVKVAVVLHRGEELAFDELIAHCHERMPRFMVPRFIEFVPELPRTPTGKIEKHELRRRGENGITPETFDRERSQVGR